MTLTSNTSRSRPYGYVSRRACGRMMPALLTRTVSWPSSAAVYLPAPQPGAIFKNERLAQTYERVLREAEAETGRERQIENARADDFFTEA